MGTFYTDTLRVAPVFRSVARVHALALLEPETRVRVRRIIADATSDGIVVVPFETYRSVERQSSLFAAGATQLRAVGTHHFGLACDLVRIVDGAPTWGGDYGFLGVLARRHGLIWGGDWGRPDRPNDFVDAVHLQRCSVARQPTLFAGTWYPDATYDPYADLNGDAAA